MKWITELGRQLRELDRDIHLVGWLGLGAGERHWLFFVCLFVVAQHWFHAIHSQSPSRTLGQDTRDFASLKLPVFIVDRLAFSRLVTSSRSIECCRSKT